MEKQYWLTMSDHHSVFVTHWYDEHCQPKAILQLAHGMAEHILRYRDFANFLVQNQIFVVGNDHRGHGQTGQKSGLLGYFAENNGFSRVIDDLNEVNQHIREEYPNTPIIIMGHSMGSFLVRGFLQRYHGKVSGAILSGTGGNPGLLGKIGKWIAKSQVKKLGKKTVSPLMNKLTFSSYNKKLTDVQTTVDWLSRDRKEVQKYQEDPLCGFIPTTGFFYDLLDGVEVIHRKEEMSKMDKSVPILFFSGDHDPVGRNAKGVQEVISDYKKLGIVDIDYIFYKEGRHEMLNEINRDEVYQDVLSWINKTI